MHFIAVPVNDGIANAAGIRKVCIPPQQIVRLGVIVILPPEAVAVKLLRQRPCAGVVRIGYQRPCLAYLYRRGKSGNAIREVVRCGGISARVRERREIIIRIYARNAAAVCGAGAVGTDYPDKTLLCPMPNALLTSALAQGKGRALPLLRTRKLLELRAERFRRILQHEIK